MTPVINPDQIKHLAFLHLDNIDMALLAFIWKISHLTREGGVMEIDKSAISELLNIPEETLRLDKCLYDPRYPDEVKAWKWIDKKNRELLSHEGKLYYPASELMVLINLATEVLVRMKYPGMKGLLVILTCDMRFKKLVTPDNELLIQVKLLKTYKDKIGVFSGVIADSDGDIVAENIAKGTNMIV
jgi:hypothetical protein